MRVFWALLCVFCLLLGASAYGGIEDDIADWDASISEHSQDEHNSDEDQGAAEAFLSTDSDSEDKEDDEDDDEDEDEDSGEAMLATSSMAGRMSAKEAREKARGLREVARTKRARAAELRLKAKDLKEHKLFRSMTIEAAKKDPRFEAAIRKRTRHVVVNYLNWLRDRFLLAHARSARKFGIARNKAARRKLAKLNKNAPKPRTPKRAQLGRRRNAEVRRESRRDTANRRRDAARRRKDDAIRRRGAANRRRDAANRRRDAGNRRRGADRRRRRNQSGKNSLTRRESRRRSIRRTVTRRRSSSRKPRNGRVITRPSRIPGSDLPARHVFRDTTVDPVVTRARFGLGPVPEFPAVKPINALASDLPAAGLPRPGLPRRLERGMRGSRDLLKARWTESPEVLSPDRAYSVDRRRISTDRLGPDGRPNDLRMIPGSPDTAPLLPTFLGTQGALSNDATSSANDSNLMATTTTATTTASAAVDVPAKPISQDDDLTSPFKAKVTKDDAMGPTNIDSEPDSIGSAPDAPKSDKADKL